MDFIDFIATRWYFIIGHIFLALFIMALVYIWRAAAPTLALWMMELGQAKSKVSGSVKDPDKWIDMIVWTCQPVELVQWLFPGLLIAFAYEYWRAS